MWKPGPRRVGASVVEADEKVGRAVGCGEVSDSVSMSPSASSDPDPSCSSSEMLHQPSISPCTDGMYIGSEGEARRPTGIPADRRRPVLSLVLARIGMGAEGKATIE